MFDRNDGYSQRRLKRNWFNTTKCQGFLNNKLQYNNTINIRHFHYKCDVWEAPNNSSIRMKLFCLITGNSSPWMKTWSPGPCVFIATVNTKGKFPVSTRNVYFLGVYRALGGFRSDASEQILFYRRSLAVADCHWSYCPPVKICKSVLVNRTKALYTKVWGIIC